MSVEASKPVGFDARYVESLLLDQSNIKSRDYTAGLDLLRHYSGIPEDQLVSHVSEIQRRAYAICPYPCIGLLRFLVCSLSEHPLYPDVLTRLAENAKFLDLGCCFAQDIRKLSYDGAPTSICTAVDLEPRFFDISEDLFQDSGRLKASFVGADVLDADEKLWTELEGTVDIVHASSLFHLFGLEKQRRIARLISRIVKPAPGSLVLGLQLAAKEKAEHIPVVNDHEPSFCHSLNTMQTMWTDMGNESGLTADGKLQWQVDLTPRDVPESHRIGLLSDRRLTEVLWAAKLVQGAAA